MKKVEKSKDSLATRHPEPADFRPFACHLENVPQNALSWRSEGPRARRYVSQVPQSRLASVRPTASHASHIANLLILRSIWEKSIPRCASIVPHFHGVGVTITRVFSMTYTTQFSNVHHTPPFRSGWLSLYNIYI